MTPEQVRLLNWMYNMSRVALSSDDAHKENDILLLREAVLRRFPEHWFDIVKPYESIGEEL